ncbi:hypothetical protein NQ317_015326, partial [Molorchus minor]
MAECIDDLFECFEEAPEENDIKVKDDSLEDKQIAGRLVSVFINLKKHANGFSLYSGFQRYKSEAVKEAAIRTKQSFPKRTKVDDVDVGDIKYAVATSLKNKQRVIYTTPIKALSNQKYREFLDEFKDVGLVTGDVTINPSASCLIMTTESQGVHRFQGIRRNPNNFEGTFKDDSFNAAMAFCRVGDAARGDQRAAEKQLVDEVFNNAMDVLSDDDRHLPQVENVLPLLRRGIGIHHGGLLPILKETIEILFGGGLIKALFATETFAMGLNMPARTITSGEYIQMSGRAGRRGLDDKGIVILMVDEKVPPAAGRNMVKGLPDPINSAFHLTYNMVLNLLRVEEINPEYMLERSFYQFQNQTAIPSLYEVPPSESAHVYFPNITNKKFEKYNSLDIKSEDQIASYYKIRRELDSLGVQFGSYLTKSEYLIPFLQPGRLLKIKTQTAEYDWGAVVNFRKVQEIVPGRKGKQGQSKTITKIQVDILLHKGEVEIVTVDSSLVTHLSSVRLYCPGDLRSKDSRKGMYKSIKEVKRRFPEGPPLLNPIVDMKIKDPDFVDIVRKIEILEKKYIQNIENMNRKLCAEELKVARQKLLDAKSVLQLDELKCRKRVLRRLGYCTNTDVIQLKGRVACELSSADELLITEMIFNGVFGNLLPAQACALLSCFVCDEKVQELPKLSEELSGPLRQMQ